MTRRVLVLGGTAEARALAAELAARGLDVTTSLAGRTRHPRLPGGRGPDRRLRRGVRAGRGVGGRRRARRRDPPLRGHDDRARGGRGVARRDAADRAAPAGVDRGTGGPLDAGALVDGGGCGDPLRRAGPARDRPPGRRGVRRRRRVVPRPRDRGAGGAAAARRAPAGPRPLRPRRRARPARSRTRSRSSSPRTPAAPRRPSSSRPASGRCPWCSSTARPCRRA